MHANDERRASWSQYWASGALHSCAGSFDGNYDDAIAHFWRQVFESVQASDRVLDIATGNGALPQLLLEMRREMTQMPHIDAVDLAQIDPPWARSLAPEVSARLHFHSAIAAEKLPFADCSFDLVVSQYGLEYSDLSQSVVEFLRVSKAQARLALIVHHADSLPVRLGRAELLEIDWLSQSGGLLQRTRRLLPFLARLNTPAGMASVQRDPSAAKARSQYNDSMRELQLRSASSGAPDILLETQAALGALTANAATIGLAPAEARLAAMRESLRMARLRQAELVGHALDAQAVDALAARLAPLGVIEVAQIRVQSELFGWSLRTQ